MTRKLYSLLLVLCIALPLYAQTDKNDSFTLKGQVIDSLTNETVPYATLSIALASAPQKPVKLLACDIDGKFQTPMAAAGKYIISMQSIGKAPVQKEFELTDNQKMKDVGKLYMQEDNQRLSEVTVTAQKPLVKVEIDKLTYNLEDDPEAKTSNTLDMLRKVPMITVDGEDKIELKGSSNFKIYMNGKPSNMLNSNPGDVLRSMPANSVKNIEVITDPGAKYDAEGIGGIINIITTKNALQGYTGSVQANASATGRLGGGTYLSAKIGKVGITANYNYNHMNTPWNESESVRENLMAAGNEAEHTLNQFGRSKYKGPFQFGNLEGSYEIDSLNLISVGANLFRGQMKNTSEYDVNSLNGSGGIIEHYKRNSTSENTFGSTDLNVDYQRSTRKKDEMFTLSYRFSQSPSDNNSYTDILNVSGYEDSRQWNINDASTNEHTAQADYTTPTWKDQTLETGAKYIFRQSNSETLRQLMDSTGNWADASASNSDFKHTQHIYSGYLGYAMKFTKFGVKAGVRAEGTALDVKYARSAEQNFDTHYFDIVPNGTVSYQIDMSQQIRLGYNMRIQRPGIWYLNPYINNTDPKNISYGNPDLDSEKSNNINFNYSNFGQKFSINVSGSYTFVNNSIERYIFIDPSEPDVSRTTYDNIGRKQQTGMFLYGSWNPIPKLRLSVNGGIDYTDLRSEQMNLANSGFSGRVFGNAQLTLPLDFRIDAYGGYFSPRVELQGKMSSFRTVGLGINKSFLKKKLTVQVSCQSPFWKTMKFESTTFDPTFTMRNINHQTMRDIRINVTYRFGTLKDSIKKVKRGISNDDMKSGGNSGGGQEGG